MAKKSKLLWKEDDSKSWFTPGGDPVWVCPVCGKGKHVYGIENINEPKTRCPDCGAKIDDYDFWR
jgi:rubrerythrin